jgi:adenylate cyclase
LQEGERRLAAIMFVDVVGYTALTQKDEPFALQAVSRIRQLSSSVFDRHGGRLVKTMGDGFLVEFSSAMDGVLCGIELQHMMRERSAEAPGGGAQIKIGIHVGDVIHENGDVLGDAVNIASRIEPLAGPGEICISGEVMKQVKSRLSYAMVPMGPQKLKNVSEPVETYKVLLPGSGQSEARALAAGRDRRRLVVLPMNSYSPDPNDEYFADGMTEEIITKLSGLTGLRVIARTSAMKYKGVKKSVSEIGTELEVGSVLEGSVRKSGERMRITLQLVDASSEEHLWANSYDRNLTDVFAVQTDISEKVAEALEVKLLAKELATLQKPDTRSLQAYTYYLKGRELMSGRSEEGIKAAEKQFELAVAEDQTFARAYSGLADCTMLMGNFHIIPNEEAARRARPLVRKAIELDEGLAEAHASLGLFFMNFDLEWAGAEREFKRAIEINPGYAQAHHWYSLLLSNLAQVDAMLSEARIALELDPLSAAANSAASTNFFLAGKYDQALRFARRALELSPRHPGARFMHVMILWGLGQNEEALKMAEEWRSQEPKRASATAVLAWVLAETGKLDKAKLLVEEMEALRPRANEIPGLLWFLYVPLGNLDKAFEYLNQAIDTREQDPSVVRLASGLEPMRADPRYHELLKRVNLEP